MIPEFKMKYTIDFGFDICMKATENNFKMKNDGRNGNSNREQIYHPRQKRNKTVDV